MASWEWVRSWLQLFCRTLFSSFDCLTIIYQALGKKKIMNVTEWLYIPINAKVCLRSNQSNTMTCHTSCLQCKPAGRACVSNSRPSVAPLLYTFHAFSQTTADVALPLCPQRRGVDIAVFVVWARLGLECDALSLGTAAKQTGLGRRRNCTPHGYLSSSSGPLGDSSSVTWIILLHKEPHILPLKRLYAVLCCVALISLCASDNLMMFCHLS